MKILKKDKVIFKKLMYNKLHSTNQRQRFFKVSIKKKFLFIPIIFAILSILALFISSASVQSTFNTHVHVTHPIYKAVFELEINYKEALAEVLKNEHHGSELEHINALFEDAVKDFNQAFQIYKQELNTQNSSLIQSMFDDFQTDAKKLFQLSQEQKEKIQTRRVLLNDHLEHYLDDQLQNYLNKSRHNNLEKIIILNEIEINIHELISAVRGYLIKNDSFLQARVDDSIVDVESWLAQYKALQCDTFENEVLHLIEKDLHSVENLSKEIMALEDEILIISHKLEKSGVEFDRLLDDVVQIEMENFLKNETEDIQSKMKSLFALLIALVVVFIVISFKNTRLVINDISALLQAVTEFEKTGQITPLQYSDDELGNLSRSMHSMMSTLDQELSKNRELLVKFTLVAKLTNQGIWKWNFTDDSLEWDDIMFKLYGMNRKDITYLNWSRSLHPDDREASQNKLLLAKETHTDFQDIYRIVLSNGEIRHIKAVATLEFDKEGKATSMIGSNLDISESIQYQEKLRQAKEKAEDAAKAKSDFLANMSHELRTPLNGMLGFVAHLLKNDYDEDTLRELRIINNSGKQLLEVINDILDFSKIEAGMLSIESQPYDIRELISMSRDTYLQIANDKSINLQCVIDDNTPQILKGDQVRIRQIIYNLLSNAVKFTPENGEITLNINYENNANILTISIKDTGIGIPQNKLESIFEAFSQEDISTTRKYGGTGLGLTLSMQLVKMMGGDIKVDSVVGKGSTFTVELPTQVCDNVEKCLGRIEQVDDIEDIRFNGKVLVVEDNKTNQMLITMILGDLGLDFEIANDGVHALEKFKSNRYDLVFMDENMPNMNGIEATSQIRALESNESLDPTPIVALTANALSNDKKRFLDAGMDDYIPKPYSERDIVAMLQKYLPGKED